MDTGSREKYTMATLTKIAFVDIDTGEFYRDTKQDVHRFTDDVTRAQLYHERKEIRQFFRVIGTESGRDLKCVEVKVEFLVCGDSDYIDWIEKQQADQDWAAYEKLNQKAEKDVDAMSEKDFRAWRGLRKKFRNREEEQK